MTMRSRGRSLAALVGLVAGSVAAFVILFAFAALVMISPARAADKGSTGLGDLEERVAELEATVARKGNRKMTVILYGQVNKAILWHDGFVPGGKNARGVIDNTNSPTMLGVMGTAKIAPGWTAGYRLELGVNEKPAILVLDDQVSVRHSAAWLDGPMGKFTIGRTSMATDGVGEVAVANTMIASKLLSLQPMSDNVLFGIDLPYDGPRRDVVRYDSPAFGGFIVSASWSSGPGVGILGQMLTNGSDDTYDVALRYAGEFGGFRVAGAVGYRKENYLVSLIPLNIPTQFLLGRDSVITGSGSVMHMASGLFVNLAAGFAQDEVFKGSGIDHNTYHVQAGWEKKVNALGATTLYGEYGRLKITGVDEQPNFMGAGVVQKIDGAAMDVYASYRRYDLDDGGDKIQTFMAGVRVQF